MAGKNYEELQEHLASRKLNIVKGFKEASETPPVNLADLKKEVGEDNVFTIDVIKGFTNEILEKGNDCDQLSLKEQYEVLVPVSVVDERGLHYNVYIEKGKRALVGEIRHWKDNKYRKLANGKWERVIDTYVEEFVDEDTGEVVSIEREVKKPDLRTQAERDKEWLNETEGNPTRRRKQRKADKREEALRDERWHLGRDLDNLVQEYKDYKQQLKDIDTEMNEEAGQMGDRWNDHKANEYGARMMKVEAEMEELMPKIKDLKIQIENIQNRETDVWAKSPEGIDADIKYEAERIARNKELEEEWEKRNSSLTKALDDADTIIKGHMDFGSSMPRQGLVKKEVQDKRGHKTHRWVKEGEDEPEQKDKKESVEDESDETPKGDKTSSDYAKETDTNDLIAYLKEKPDGAHAEEAMDELKSRGEEHLLENPDGGDYEEEVDYNNPESVKFALDAHPDKDAIIDYAIEHGVTPGQAMKMHTANATDHTDTHAKIDSAQEALNELKDHTGHPDTKTGVVGEQGEKVDAQYLNDIMEDSNSREDFIKKVNYGITDEQSTVSPENDEAIGNYWDSKQSESESEEGGKDYMDDWQHDMEQFLDTDFGDDSSEMASRFVEIANEIQGFDPTGERMYNTAMEVIANNMEAETLYEALYDADAHENLIGQLEKEFNDIKGGENISYDEWEASAKMGQGGPEFDDEGFGGTGREVYGMESLMQDNPDGITDEDDILDAIDYMSNIVDDTEGTADKMMANIAKQNDKETFLRLLEQETSDDETLSNLEMMYDEASQGGEEVDRITTPTDTRTDEEMKSDNTEHKDTDTDTLIESMAEKIFNAQGKDNSTAIFDMYQDLRARGLSDEEIESKMEPMAWGFPQMSDEERQGMKEDWDATMSSIKGDDTQPNPKDKTSEDSIAHMSEADHLNVLDQYEATGNYDVTDEQFQAIREKYKHLRDDDDIDPAGGRGLRSHE